MQELVMQSTTVLEHLHDGLQNITKTGFLCSVRSKLRNISSSSQVVAQ